MTETNATESKRMKLPLLLISAILTVGLIFFQATGLISISWWLVFLPLLVGVGFTLVTLVVIFLLATIAVALAESQKK